MDRKKASQLKPGQLVTFKNQSAWPGADPRSRSIYVAEVVSTDYTSDGWKNDEARATEPGQGDGTWVALRNPKHFSARGDEGLEEVRCFSSYAKEDVGLSTQDIAVVPNRTITGLWDEAAARTNRAAYQKEQAEAAAARTAREEQRAQEQEAAESALLAMMSPAMAARFSWRLKGKHTWTPQELLELVQDIQTHRS